MADFSGELFTTPTFTNGTQDGDGILFVNPNLIEGVQDGYGQIFQSFTTVCPPPPVIIIHYALSMFDNTNVRHFWTDTSITTANAPSGPTYLISTFAIEGFF